MKSFGMTNVGQKRNVNQDYIFYTDDPVGCLDNLYIVADGMGGHKAGDKASHESVEKFIEEIRSYPMIHPFLALKNAIEKVNSYIWKIAGEQPEYEGMGTTFVAATIKNNTIFVMNVGDSRLYYKEQKLEQITKDHSLVEELVRNGELTKEEAMHHPQKNVITRAIGAGPMIEADFFHVKYEEQGQILLCSDGLTNMIEDHEIAKILESDASIYEKTEVLVQKANEAGGLDNFSIIIVTSGEER